MKKIVWLGIILCSASFQAGASEGLIKHESAHSVTETADRFEKIAKSKGLTLFSRVDHQTNAKSVGLALRPTEVIIFGNPKVGTLLMQCAQDVAIDLPQKILVSEDADHKVWLSYNAPSYLMKRHGITGCDEVVNKISGALSKLAKAAVAQ